MIIILGKNFNDDGNTPLFLQIKERIEEYIVQGVLAEEEQIPSTTQIVAQYKINHITVSKGINLLVDQGIIYKKRGVGMFVVAGAKAILLEQRANSFSQDYVEPLIKEAKNLNIKKDDVIKIIEEGF